MTTMEMVLAVEQLTKSSRETSRLFESQAGPFAVAAYRLETSEVVDIVSMLLRAGPRNHDDGMWQVDSCNPDYRNGLKVFMSLEDADALEAIQ